MALLEDALPLLPERDPQNKRKAAFRAGVAVSISAAAQECAPAALGIIHSERRAVWEPVGTTRGASPGSTEARFRRSDTGGGVWQLLLLCSHKHWEAEGLLVLDQGPLKDSTSLLNGKSLHQREATKHMLALRVRIL